MITMYITDLFVFVFQVRQCYSGKPTCSGSTILVKRPNSGRNSHPLTTWLRWYLVAKIWKNRPTCSTMRGKYNLIVTLLYLCCKPWESVRRIEPLSFFQKFSATVLQVCYCQRANHLKLHGKNYVFCIPLSHKSNIYFTPDNQDT